MQREGPRRLWIVASWLYVSVAAPLAFIMTGSLVATLVIALMPPLAVMGWWNMGLWVRDGSRKDRQDRQ